MMGYGMDWSLGDINKMRKYLPRLIQILSGPPAHFYPRLSLSRLLNKRTHLKQCLKLFKYHSEDELDRDLSFSYYRLVEGLREKDSPLVLRHLSVDLFQQYQKQPAAFDLQSRISDVVILDCRRVSKEREAVSWFQLSVKIKHFDTSKQYQLERKFFEDSFTLQSSSPRKWYFVQLPLHEQPK